MYTVNCPTGNVTERRCCKVITETGSRGGAGFAGLTAAANIISSMKVFTTG